MTQTATKVRLKCTNVFQRNWQAIFARNEADRRRYKYLINSGSSRSSKTHSLIQILYLYALNNPGKKLSVFRDTKQICKETILDDMLKVYPGNVELGLPPMPCWDRVNYNITNSILKFPNGSAIHIEGTDDSVKIHGYSCDVLWINEGYNVSEETFRQLNMRCRDFVILDLNPRESHWSDEVANYEDAILIHSTWKDNPFCPPEQKRVILSRQPVVRCELVMSGAMTEMEAKTYDLHGNPKKYGAKLIKELIRCRDNEDKGSASVFDWDVYGLGIKGERPNRIFHFTEISDEKYKSIEAPIYYGVDWGAVDPWGIVEGKYYDGAMYWHELNYHSENVLREKIMSATDRAQCAGSEEGIVTWLFSRLNINKRQPVICDNNRIEKVTALRRAGYPAFLADKKAGSINDGIDLINNIKNYYTRSSVNLAKEQENYSRKVDRYGVVEEEPEDANNHLMDPIRYVARYLREKGIIKKL